MSYKIVAFGDSNTRYYLGDTGELGPIEQAWPARLEAMLQEQGLDVQIHNEGWPGEQMDFAMAQFSHRTAGSKLCILSFGTNDIKKLEVPLGLFLSELSDVLAQAETAGIPILVLGIPWFEECFMGPEIYNRLPVWNLALKNICVGLSVPFVGLYEAFQQDPEHWFNERIASKHHLSGAAQMRVAELLFPAVLPLIQTNM